MSAALLICVLRAKSIDDVVGRYFPSYDGEYVCIMDEWKFVRFGIDGSWNYANADKLYELFDDPRVGMRLFSARGFILERAYNRDKHPCVPYGRRNVVAPMGCLMIDRDEKCLYVGDGETPGGRKLL